MNEHAGYANFTPGTHFPVTASVRDALYDLIPLAEPELALLSTVPFLRLERIQQLGFVSRIWPGAHHTRYEHSIGVFHLARLALASLMNQGREPFFSLTDARTLAAAALLHDIGHYPFSHAIEELGAPIEPHEVVGARIIESVPVAEILSRDWQVDPERVAALVSPAGRDLPGIDRLLRSLLSGPLDVDKLDYLPRDARACNVPYGGVDTARLLGALRIVSNDAGETRIVVDKKGVSPLHSLINARQEMFDNVYWHHANRAAMVMLMRAVQEAMLVGCVDPHQLTASDDSQLLALLQDARMPDSTRRLATNLQHRKFHKRALEISNRAGGIHDQMAGLYHDPVARRLLELEMTRLLSDKIGEELPAETVLIDIPKPERWHTDVQIQFDNPPIGFSTLMHFEDVVGLTSSDFKRYEEHRRLIRIVISADQRERLPRSGFQEILRFLEQRV